MLRYLTCGESHGKFLSGILEGMPSNVEIDIDNINYELKRRQSGYGRGHRSIGIEKDTVEIIGGIRWGKTTGSPIGLLIENSDWENRKKEMSPYKEDQEINKSILCPRPGHADLAGMLKYNTYDAKDILERASARSTAPQVAIGSICRQFLEKFNINVIAYVKSIGDIEIKNIKIKNAKQFQKYVEEFETRCPDNTASKKMIDLIDKAKKNGDTLGGVVHLEILNVPIGFASHVHWDRRLDANLAQMLMSIPSVKAVAIGNPNSSKESGSEFHDEIFYNNKKGFYRNTNNAGGIEGGISNGENISVDITLKPIPTLMKPLSSVNVKTKKSVKAESVRSDVCVAPSAVVVAEAVSSFVIANEHRIKFGGDSLEETMVNFKNYIKQIGRY